MYLVRIPGLVAIEQTDNATHAHSAFNQCEVAGTQLCRIEERGTIRVLETKKSRGFVGLSVEELKNLQRRAVALGVK